MSENNITESGLGGRGGFGKWRYIIALLSAIGMAIIYGLKVNISVAIVVMVNQTAISANSMIIDEHNGHNIVASSTIVTTNETENNNNQVCARNDLASADTMGSGSDKSDGPFIWSETDQGLILSSYFWGYFITQIPGGRLAELTSAKLVFLVAVFINVAGTILTPIMAKTGFVYLLIVRCLEGLAGGVTFPAMNVILSKWAPSQERSTFSSIIFGGTALGTVISIPTSGIIAGYLGWESVFYIHGGLACIWCLLWILFTTDTPKDHRFISKEEKEFILQNTSNKNTNEGQKSKPPPVPWMSILTSVPFWAIIICHTLNNFGWYMLLVELPTFMRSGLNFDVKENGLLLSIPFLLNWFFSMANSKTLDWARQREYISTGTARKISVGISTIIPALCLIGMVFSGCSRTGVVTLMIVGVCFYGAMFSGVFANHVDIASNFAGVLMGITNMAATIPGFVVPALVGKLTHGKIGLGPWHTLFYLTAGLLFLEFGIYLAIGSGKEQSWNVTKTQEFSADPDCEDVDQEHPLKNLGKENE